MFRCVFSDDFDFAIDVVRELEETNDDISEVVERVTWKAVPKRPRRVCQPSEKAIRAAEMGSSTECESG
jgi:hypothetical protein